MSDTTSGTTASPVRRSSFSLSGVGIVLLGVATLIFSFAFAGKRFTSDTNFPKQKLGYELVSINGQAYLLDREDGHIWERKTPYQGASTSAWCIAEIENRRKIEREALATLVAPAPCR